MSVYSKLTAIADAIRANTGGTELLTLDDMATAISEGSGGFGLTIVDGLDRPTNPTQGMIWAKTEHNVTYYDLSAAKPENPVEGTLWLNIGDSGQRKIVSTVNKELITVYPLSAKQSVGEVTNFRYIKLQMDALNGSEATVQFSDIRFMDDDGGYFAYPSGVSVYSSIAAASTEENETKLIDNDASTKFCSTKWVSGSHVLIDLGPSTTIDITRYKRWCWYTASDAVTYPERNPKSFSLWGSNDGNNFTLIDSVTNHSVPLQNSAVAYAGTIASVTNWVDVPVMSYQNETWVSWYTEIFTSGKGNVVSVTAKPRTDGKGIISVSNDGITIGYSSSWEGTDVIYYTNTPVDITGLSVLKLTAQISEMRTDFHFNGFGLIKTIPPAEGSWVDQNWVATTEINDNSNTSKEFTVDISTVSPGQYYFLFVAAATKGTITDIRIV